MERLLRFIFNVEIHDICVLKEPKILTEIWQSDVKFSAL